MIKEFNNIKEIGKYYEEKSNTYVFVEKGIYFDVVFNFDLIERVNIMALNIKANDINVNDIIACNIEARDIEARNMNVEYINARDIDVEHIIAWGIKARNIYYYAVCVAYRNIKCKSIYGRRKNAKHFVLDGTLEVEEDVD